MRRGIVSPVEGPDTALGRVLTADLSDPDAAPLTAQLVLLLARTQQPAAQLVADTALQLWRSERLPHGGDATRQLLLERITALAGDPTPERLQAVQRTIMALDRTRGDSHT